MSTHTTSTSRNNHQRITSALQLPSDGLQAPQTAIDQGTPNLGSVEHSLKKPAFPISSRSPAPSHSDTCIQNEDESKDIPHTTEICCIAEAPTSPSTAPISLLKKQKSQGDDEEAPASTFTTSVTIDEALSSPTIKRRMLNDGTGVVVPTQASQAWRQQQAVSPIAGQQRFPLSTTQQDQHYEQGAPPFPEASSSSSSFPLDAQRVMVTNHASRDQASTVDDSIASRDSSVSRLRYESGTNTFPAPEETRHSQRGGRVLLLRNLLPSVLEADVEAFVSPFIRTSTPKIYLQFAAGQAFVEFGTLQEAQHAYQYFRAHPTSLKGQTVQIHFSDRQCVTAPDDKNGDFRVLLATVTSLMYPVDIELLKFLFSRFGTVQKIISFSKSSSSSTFQALIQMADAQMARDALQALHSRNIYDGCNTLQIQPSRLSELTVRINNSRAWDYTVAPDGLSSRTNSLDAGGLITGQLRQGHGSPSMESNHAPRIQDENQMPSGSAVQHRCQSPAFAKVFGMPRLPKEVREWKATVVSNASAPTNVLIVYNLTPNVVTVTELFNVFSLYGILQRVKILRDKPHTALLQYSDPLYASLAAHFLQQAAFFDQKQGIQIGFSRNAEVKLSHGVGPENLKRTRAFQAQEQRYNPNEIEKFIRAACSPTCTLFIANLREDTDEISIRSLIQPYGTATKIQIRAPPDGGRRRFAMVEMSNKNEALYALAHLHNTYVEHSSIKVAFSKRVISDMSDMIPLSPGLEGCEPPIKEINPDSVEVRPVTASTTTN